MKHDQHRGCFNKTLAAGSLLAAGIAFSAETQAAVAFEQAPANGNDAYSSISAEQAGDSFSLAASKSIDALSWWGSYSADPSGLPADQFQVRLFQDTGAGLPQANPFATLSGTTSRTATGLLDATSATVYRYDLALANSVTLTGGTVYYLSVVNGFDVNNANANWYWLLSDASGSNFFRFAEGQAWQGEATGNLAFNLATVPLPAAVWLWLSGMALLGLVGKRGKK